MGLFNLFGGKSKNDKIVNEFATLLIKCSAAFSGNKAFLEDKNSRLGGMLANSVGDLLAVSALLTPPVLFRWEDKRTGAFLIALYDNVGKDFTNSSVLANSLSSCTNYVMNSVRNGNRYMHRLRDGATNRDIMEFYQKASINWFEEELNDSMTGQLFGGVRPDDIILLYRAYIPNAIEIFTAYCKAVDEWVA